MHFNINCLAAPLLCLLAPPLFAQANHIAATPPMGWNSWNHFADKVTDADVRAAADSLVSSGMRDAGYLYVNIDDTWEAGRDAQGNIQTNSKFPDMKALGDYIHSKGLKFGIYSSPGPKTCANFEGSYNHEQQDADTYAQWGVDYLKYDLCSFSEIMKKQSNGDQRAAWQIMHQAYEKMHQALLRANRPIVFSLCQYGFDAVWKWGPDVGGNSWRTTTDISDNWNSMSTIGFQQAGLAHFAGPGHWNDPDMLEIGNGHMTDEEYRVHISLWSLLSAPLLAGNDLSKMSGETISILTNKEVIALDQDPLGKQADRVSADGPFEIWAKQLSNGSKAVALFNRGEAPYPMTLSLKQVGISHPAKARDLWQHKNLGNINDDFTVVVPRHGVFLLTLQ